MRKYTEEIYPAGRKVTLDVTDNGSNNTVVMIHGYMSDETFTKNIESKDNNFNIVKFTFPVWKDISFEYLTNIARDVVSKIKSKNVYVLGHSLGGAISASINLKVKKTFFVSPFHPFMMDYLPYKFLKARHTTNRFSEVTRRLQSSDIFKTNDLKMFLDTDSYWFNIVRNSLLKQEFIDQLDNNYNTTKNRIFICGNRDYVISTSDLKRYAHHLGDVVYEVDGRHNPMGNDKISMILNAEIPRSKKVNYYKIF